MGETNITNFNEYLKKHKATKGSGLSNHTRIGDEEYNAFSGSYTIETSEWKDFIQKYYQHVFVNKKVEHLTEKQLIENGPITIDIDFRYAPSITTKQHTEDHIIDAVDLYVNKILELVEVKSGVEFDVFVLEKEKVNTSDSAQTKDGIHMIIGVKMHKGLQVLLREKVLPDLKNMWDDLPLTCTWDNVLDEGVVKGQVNWQMTGSSKPGHQPYKIKYHYVMSYDRGDSSWEMKKQNVANFNSEKYIEKMSARYTENPEFEIRENIKPAFEVAKKNLGSKTKTNIPRGNFKLKIMDSPMTKGSVSLCPVDEVDSEETLDGMLETLFVNSNLSDYKLKETHQYTMILPEKYWGEGSYLLWMGVGWALANSSPKLFLTWLKFSCQNKNFDWGRANIKELYEKWNGFETSNPAGLTSASIRYWARNDVPEKYKVVHKETSDFFVEQTIKTSTEYDIANLCFNLYKDDYKCISIKNNCWYEYNYQHRWVENDSGNSLRNKISTHLHKIYMDKANQITEQTAKTTDPEALEKLKIKSKKIAEICLTIKKTNWKNNIMRESREIFYDDDFIEKIDENPYLLGFNNCVIDFKNKIYRKGRPDDYVSKSTNNDYIPYETCLSKHADKIAEINDFMAQLFPEEELRRYMWDHAAATCIGTNINQTFNIYKGTGRNGKSKFTDLMTYALGDYKGTVPITLITQKRNSVGGTSSEVVQLKGVRYAVMQEPTKGDRINEGVMKELTGGDPIQARALFKDSITFVPQFKLVVCTNKEFEDLDDDDGTWRRIRMVDFKSKMLHQPFNDPKFPTEDFPYQFPIDLDLDVKLRDWAPYFMSMLVEKAYVLQGVVTDCKIVMSSSDNYRERQDYFTKFRKENLRSVNGGKGVKKTEISEQFKKWYILEYGMKGMPPGKEIYEMMDKCYGEIKQHKWRNVEIIYDVSDDNPLDC